MSKPDIDTLHREIEALLRDACATSFMGSRALMAIDPKEPGRLDEFKLFARDYHEIVYSKLDDLEEKARALVAATKH